MLLLVACSRTLTPADLDAALAASGWTAGAVVPLSGVARRWADERGLPVVPLAADWRRHRTAARAVLVERACRLAKEGGGALLAAWNGAEPSTRAVLVAARGWWLPCHVHEVRAAPRCCKTCGEPVGREKAGEKAEEMEDVALW